MAERLLELQGVSMGFGGLTCIDDLPSLRFQS